MEGNAFNVAATVDIGNDRERQEDFVSFEELDDDNLFAIVADGSGSTVESMQPAVIVAMEITNEIRFIFDKNKDLFLSAPELFMENAIRNSHRVLTGFKMGNEEKFVGYAASLTCVLLHNEGERARIYMAHTGNTRLYILRNGNLNQLSADHTKAAELLEEGLIDINTYHIHPDRLVITGGVGGANEPPIQTKKGILKDNDILVMTTDGIHYAARPEEMARIILEAGNPDDSAAELVYQAKSTKYPDNMAAMIITRKKDVNE